MLLRPEYLSQKLDRPLPTKDGGILCTIRDACDWQRIAKLIVHSIRDRRQVDRCRRGPYRL
jgi:hypothetical protein